MPEGRIMKALSGFYYVAFENQLYQCRGRGNFRKKNITPLVGDNVSFSIENETDGYILEVFERKNELVRPPIVNVDQAILVFSAVEPDFNPGLLDRFLVLIEAKNIEPIICVTKMDLLDEKTCETVNQYIKEYKQAGYEVICTSSKKKEGIEDILPFFKDKISVFAGQSGVGKSSLINAIRPELELKTNEISSHLGRGKHTTRHVELIEINDGLVADTPGFSSLDFIDIEVEDLNHCFIDIQRLSEDCKFRGCLHMNEPKCAVKAAVETGELPSYRYESYKNFFAEIKDRKPRY